MLRPLKPQRHVLRGPVERIMGVHVDGDDGGGRGDLAQQDAVRADDARRLYRRRRIDRHGVRRSRRQRGGAQGDREARDQSRGHSARRRNERWRSRRLRQRIDTDRHRRPGDPARSARRRRGELSHPPVGPGPVCQPELDDQHPGRQRQLSADDKLADRRRARDHAGG